MIGENMLCELYEAVGVYSKAMDIFYKELISPLSNNMELISFDNHTLVFGSFSEFIKVHEDLSTGLNECEELIGIPFASLVRISLLDMHKTSLIKDW